MPSTPPARARCCATSPAGEHRHEQCDAHGYHNLKPRQARALPPIAEGSAHRLRADLQGTMLTVTADGVVAWEGDVGGAVTQLEGPVGLRTDNARFEFKYRAGLPDPAAGGDPDRLYHCAQDGAD